MRLLQLIWQRAPGAFVGAALLGLFAGALNTTVLVVALGATRGQSVFGVAGLARLALLFVVAALVHVFVEYASSVILSSVPTRFVSDLRIGLVQSLARIPLADIEQLGTARLQAALTEQVRLVGTGATALPILVTNVCIVLGLFGYMAVVAPAALAMALVVIAGAFAAFAGVQRGVSRNIGAYLVKLRALQSQLESVVAGAKELRANRVRRELFLEQHFLPTATAVRDEQQAHLRSDRAVGALILAATWLLLGSTVFVAPHFGRGGGIATAMLIIFMVSPLALITGQLPNLFRGSHALVDLESLEQTSGKPSDLGSDPFEFTRAIELRGVVHSYRREEDERPFHLGPIDLAVAPGELLFIVGGNGSGKTTLAKLLVGFYEPEAGEISVDGRVVGVGDRDAYRQLFSSVFADYHLFDWLPSASHDNLANQLLAQLRLDHVVQIHDGRFSTTRLSTGQRKRLALVASYLEDRPVHLFDEWAADQDPTFKVVFYETLLPSLRARGKTCVVVTHDDAFFRVADRVVYLQDGQIERRDV